MQPFTRAIVFVDLNRYFIDFMLIMWTLYGIQYDNFWLIVSSVIETKVNKLQKKNSNVFEQ